MAAPSSVVASRIRYRLSKPKPNIDAGKRLTIVSNTAISAVNSQRGLKGNVSAPIPVIPLHTINTSKDNCNVEITETSSQRPSSPPLTATTQDNPGTEKDKSDPVPNKQVTLIVTPKKTNVPAPSVTLTNNRENVEDSTRTVATNLPAIKPRERKASVRGGGDCRDKEETTRQKYKKGPNPPERSKMTMFDLIYWNPESNPMVQEDAPELTNESSEIIDSESRRLEEAVDDPDDPGEVDLDGTVVSDPDKETPPEIENGDDEDSMPVPQVTIGPDGNIILDEQSLVVQTSAAKKGLPSTVAVHERSSIVTYNSFRKRKLSRTWSDHETSKFYMALSTVGTDFSMMKNLFPKRERHELKLKYKREEKYNKALVDKAIHDQQQYDLSLFEQSNSENENPEESKKKRNKRDTSNKRKNKTNTKPADQNKGKNAKGGRKRRIRLQQESDTEDDEIEETATNQIEELMKDVENEGVVMEEVPTNTEEAKTITELTPLPVTEETDKIDDNSNDEDDYVMMDNVLKRTRSGRQPKKRVPFTLDEAIHKRRKKIEDAVQQENELEINKQNNLDVPESVLIDNLIIDIECEQATATYEIIDLDASDVTIICSELPLSTDIISINN